MHVVLEMHSLRMHINLGAGEVNYIYVPPARFDLFMHASSYGHVDLLEI